MDITCQIAVKGQEIHFLFAYIPAFILIKAEKIFSKADNKEEKVVYIF